MRVDGASWRAVVAQLRSDWSFPFKDHTSLMDFAADGWPLPKPVAASTPSSTTIQVLESFKRTTADLRALEKCETFFITSAVNNCDADPDFLQAVTHFCDERDAQLLINKVRYKNPTRRDDAATVGEWWDKNLREFMLEQELRPHPFVSIMTMKAQATAANPLPTRADALTKDRSAIFGHPQLSLRTVPVPHLQDPKTLYSSGACTVPWYSDTVAGELAEFHHSIGGVVLEVRGDKFFMREVTWSTRDKAFIDIDRKYTADGVEAAPPALLLNMGDIHVPIHSPEVMHATFGPGGIYEVTQPAELMIHDLANGEEVNPHEFQNSLLRGALGARGSLNVEAGIRKVMAWLDGLPRDCKRTVVRSNHDEFYDRWLQAGERHVEPENKLFYHELSAAMLRGYEADTFEFPQALETAIDLLGGLESEVRWLNHDESYRVAQIEQGMHGHYGTNGSRGNLKMFARVGSRSNTAHAHGYGIWQGGYQNGHSAKRKHGYNKGMLSGWGWAHTLLNALGYRQMLIIKYGGEYRG
jgi:hypothetical protein